MLTTLLPRAAVAAALALAVQPAPASAESLAPPGHHRTYARHGDRPGTLTAPAGIAVSAGRVAVADPATGRVAVFGRGGRHLRDLHGFRSPEDVAWTPGGDLVVADTKSNRIRVVAADGTARLAFGGPGLETGEFLLPMGVDVSPDGSIVVADHANDRVQVFDPLGRWRSTIDDLPRPRGVAAGRDRFVVAVTSGLAVLDGDGRLIRRIELGWDPRDVTLDGSGRILASDPLAGRVVVLARDGSPLASFGRFGGSEQDFAGAPSGVTAAGNGAVHAVDSAGLVHVWRFHRCAGRPATHVGTDGPDRIDGTKGADVIVALGGDDDVRGGGGNDLLCLGAGDDAARGGGGADRIRGGPGADHLRGGEGADEVRGGGADDRMWGGDRDDVLVGGPGRDTLRGGRGTDQCTGGRGPDVVRSCEAGSGDDV